MNRKILFFIPSLAHGGAERVMTNLANRFDSEGYDTCFLLYFKDDNEYYTNPGVKKYYLEQVNSNCRLLYNIKLLLNIRRTINQISPDIALSFLGRPNLLFLLATIGLYKIRRFSSVRSTPEFEFNNFQRRILVRLLFPTADGIILQTANVKEWFVKKKIKINSRIIPNMIGESFFDKPCCGKRKNIVSVGRLSSVKNQKLLISAFSKIIDYTDENLLIYGTGELKDDLNNYIKDLNLESRVFLMGLSNNIADEIKDSKLFVLSSDFEGSPNALLEALALGIPSISTDCPCGGPKEIIKEGNNGFLVPVGDTEALAKKMIYVLSLSENEINKISSHARQSLEKYRPEIVFKEWKEFLLNNDAERLNE